MRKKNELEAWRDTVVVGVEVAWMAAAWTPSSEAEGDLLVSAVGVLQRDSEEDQRSFCQAKAPPQKRRAVGGDARLCVSTCADERHGTEDGGGGRERHGGAELCPECSQRAALGPAHVR